jgi:cell division transport system permease protein
VKVDKPENIQQVAAECVDVPGVIHVAYAAEFLDRYMKVMLVLGIICIATIGLLLLFAYSSINNIIGVSIYARRSEIRIMQLVGATWWFIRWPFLFEGMFFGAAGALVALVVIWVAVAVGGEWVHALALPWVDLSLGQLLLWLSALLGFLGVAIGLFGSLKTVNTFLQREANATIDAQRVRQLLRS